MEVTTHVTLTPEAMASEFWKMGSDDQCKFFESLGKNIGDATYNAELQWCYVAEGMQKNDLARSTLMSLAAPLFWHTLNYMEK